MEPFWIMIAHHPIRKKSLHDAKEDSVATRKVGVRAAINSVVVARCAHQIPILITPLNVTIMPQITKRTDDVEWLLPPNTLGRTVRIQCEGVKSLQLAEVLVEKGGVTMELARSLEKDEEGNVLSLGDTTHSTSSKHTHQRILPYTTNAQQTGL